MKYYISGPVSGYDLEERLKHFGAWQNRLVSAGHEVVNPTAVVPGCEDSCEGADHPGGHTWSCWMKYTLRAMLDCEAIFMLESWENSKGACLELYVATQIGMKVLFAKDYTTYAF